jgi:hypothetical protein
VELVINEKKVVLRDKLPARLGWDVIVTKAGVLQKSWNEIEFDDLTALLAVAVESWEFDGDPGDPKSYTDLDLLTEFVPLVSKLGDWLNTRFGASKN